MSVFGMNITTRVLWKMVRDGHSTYSIGRLNKQRRAEGQTSAFKLISCRSFIHSPPAFMEMAKALRLVGPFLNCKTEFLVDEGSLGEKGYDTVVYVGDKGVSDQRAASSPRFQTITCAIKNLAQVDDTVKKCPTVIRLANGNDLGVQRLVFAPTGPLNRDFDDARRIEEATYEGVTRALKAGAKSPFVYVDIDPDVRANPIYEHAELVSVLGALRALYVPLEVREADEKKASKADRIGFKLSATSKIGGAVPIDALVHALEAGRIVARDIGGSDPERMAAPRVAEYVKQTLDGAKGIKIEVISDQKKLEKEFPLLGAVNRAASVIERHHGQVIILEYVGEGDITENVLLVGKGITYDTGGADVKAGGVMAGMHRDKCGAAAIAGFFKTLSILRPKGIRVVGSMSMVRNSIGENCYVADEIITSRAGVRVRVGDTDSEGRMVMADLICYMKERILKDDLKNAQVYTIATLTGHVGLSFGPGYSGVLDNGPAGQRGTSASLFQLGGRLAEPVEQSTLRREDYEWVEGKSEYEDLLQCHTLHWTKTPRGHQYPAAFMIMASGLDKHGIDSEIPIAYTHIDIAASAGLYPGIPTGTPLLALAARHILPNC